MREPESGHKPDALEPAIKWVLARGGIDQVAADVLKMTAGRHEYEKVFLALKKAKAPVGVYGLIAKALFYAREVQ